MALIGTENSIRCPNCGGIDFEEKLIVQFLEGLTIDKLRDVLKANSRAALRSTRYEYHCTKCGKKIE